MFLVQVCYENYLGCQKRQGSGLYWLVLMVVKSQDSIFYISPTHMQIYPDIKSHFPDRL